MYAAIACFTPLPFALPTQETKYTKPTTYEWGKKGRHECNFTRRAYSHPHKRTKRKQRKKNKTPKANIIYSNFSSLIASPSALSRKKDPFFCWIARRGASALLKRIICNNCGFYQTSPDNQRVYFCFGITNLLTTSRNSSRSNQNNCVALPSKSVFLHRPKWNALTLTSNDLG